MVASAIMLLPLMVINGRNQAISGMEGKKRVEGVVQGYGRAW